MGIWGSYSNIPKAIFYLLQGGCRVQGLGFGQRGGWLPPFFAAVDALPMASTTVLGWHFETKKGMDASKQNPPRLGKCTSACQPTMLIWHMSYSSLNS